MPPYRNMPAYGGGTQNRGGGSSAPPSDYTRDVIARGPAAVRERRDRLGYGSPLAAQQGLEYTAQTGRSTRPQSALFDEWMSSLVPSDYNVVLGQSEDGKYAGFKTEGELKSAIEGRAQTQRAGDRSVFDQLYLEAGGNLDRSMDDWSSGRRNAQSAESDIRAETGRDMGIVLPSSNESGVGYSSAGTNGMGGSRYGATAMANPKDLLGLASAQPAATQQSTSMADVGDGDVLGALASGVMSMQQQAAMPTRQAQSAKLWQAEQPSWQAQNQYQSSLDEWLAGQSDQYLGQQEFAQQASSVPLSAYAARSAAEYGVDPNIAAGWFGTNEDNADFQAQRNAQAIDAYGMPYSEYTSALGGLQRDAEAASDAETTAQEQAMNEAVYSITGQDGGQLSSAINVTPAQLYDMVADPAFQEYAYAIDTAVGTEDWETASEAMRQIMTAVGADPAYRGLLEYLYPDVIDAAGIGAEANGYGGL